VPAGGGESARQPPATYPSTTPGTDRAAIRFTARSDRAVRRGTYGSPRTPGIARGGYARGSREEG